MICIYCLKDKDKSYFTNKEHVIPVSFGKFKNNFTLNIVCNECNKYFADNLEIVFARGSIEGIERFHCGIKKPSDFKNSKSKPTITLEEGEFKGAFAYLEYSEKYEKILIKPCLQIGFKNIISSEYNFFLLEELPNIDSFEKGKYDFEQYLILGLKKQDQNNILLEKGFNLKKGNIKKFLKNDDDVLCNVENRINSIVLRTLAKICFNYFAYWVKDRDFILHHDFNTIRKFIRTGEIAEYPLVEISDKAILADEKNSKKRRHGHIITLNWASDKVSIVSQISLFNIYTYKISLAKNFTGKRKNLRRGHFFNITDNTILSLGIL